MNGCLNKCVWKLIIERSIAQIKNKSLELLICNLKNEASLNQEREIIIKKICICMCSFLINPISWKFTYTQNRPLWNRFLSIWKFQVESPFHLRSNNGKSDFFFRMYKTFISHHIETFALTSRNSERENILHLYREVILRNGINYNLKKYF